MYVVDSLDQESEVYLPDPRGLSLQHIFSLIPSSLLSFPEPDIHYARYIPWMLWGTSTGMFINTVLSLLFIIITYVLFTTNVNLKRN